MHCTICNHEETKVIDSRVVNDGLSVRRRRECPKCSFRFSTYEQMEILDLAVAKTDGRKESYSREKLEKGVRKALEKRPYTQDDFQMLISHIEREIQKLKKQEIASTRIGEIVMKQLKKFDKVAYIRFASVYRAFEDLEKFQEEVSGLIKTKKVKNKK